MWLTCQHVQNEPDAGKIEKGSKGEPRKEEFNLLRVVYQEPTELMEARY
jgi:hypothetical protein